MRYRLFITIFLPDNILIAVPPAPDGTIPPIFQERLLQLGEWLKINDEAIYGSYPWSVQTDSLNEEVKYFSSKPIFAIGERIIYAVFTSWPQNNVLSIYDAAFLVDYNDYRLKLLGENNKNELFVSCTFITFLLNNLCLIIMAI